MAEEATLPLNQYCLGVQAVAAHQITPSGFVWSKCSAVRHLDSTDTSGAARSLLLLAPASDPHTFPGAFRPVLLRNCDDYVSKMHKEKRDRVLVAQLWPDPKLFPEGSWSCKGRNLPAVPSLPRFPSSQPPSCPSRACLLTSRGSIGRYIACCQMRPWNRGSSRHAA